MALLMLPRVVFTHLKAGLRAALRPDPVMIGWWTQPALPTPVKQCRPSLTTVLAGWKLRCAKVAISARWKPFTRRNFKRIGLPCGVVSTAATIGVREHSEDGDGQTLEILQKAARRVIIIPLRRQGAAKIQPPLGGNRQPCLT